eukprot:gb/GECH01010023.1/.p1 GENE.gb/GECH01010023.1/~~gb/GECH01010023.1/.p1  ORF type:complete len:278 (+),score=39.94 gb/GECH01010023.1/:1-834(+)
MLFLKSKKQYKTFLKFVMKILERFDIELDFSIVSDRNGAALHAAKELGVATLYDTVHLRKYILDKLRQYIKNRYLEEKILAGCDPLFVDQFRSQFLQRFDSFAPIWESIPQFSQYMEQFRYEHQRICHSLTSNPVESTHNTELNHLVPDNRKPFQTVVKQYAHISHGIHMTLFKKYLDDTLEERIQSHGLFEDEYHQQKIVTPTIESNNGIQEASSTSENIDGFNEFGDSSVFFSAIDISDDDDNNEKEEWQETKWSKSKKRKSERNVVSSYLPGIM